MNLGDRVHYFDTGNIMTDATCGVGYAYISSVPDFTSAFHRDSCSPIKVCYNYWSKLSAILIAWYLDFLNIFCQVYYDVKIKLFSYFFPYFVLFWF